MFDDTEMVLRNAENRCCVGNFEELGACGAEESRDDDKIRRYVLLRNAPSRIAYETFIGVINEYMQTASTIWIALWTLG